MIFFVVIVLGSIHHDASFFIEKMGVEIVKGITIVKKHLFNFQTSPKSMFSLYKLIFSHFIFLYFSP